MKQNMTPLIQPVIMSTSDNKADLDSNEGQADLPTDPDSNHHLSNHNLNANKTNSPYRLSADFANFPTNLATFTPAIALEKVRAPPCLKKTNLNRARVDQTEE